MNKTQQKHFDYKLFIKTKTLPFSTLPTATPSQSQSQSQSRYNCHAHNIRGLGQVGRNKADELALILALVRCGTSAECEHVSFDLP